MLVMMFFNWKIYRTATKTTKAIRQGWTKVKGVSGDEEGGLGIHRGGGASSFQYRSSNKTNGSGSSRRTSSRRLSNTFIGNLMLVTSGGEVFLGKFFGFRHMFLHMLSRAGVKFVLFSPP